MWKLNIRKDKIFNAMTKGEHDYMLATFLTPFFKCGIFFFFSKERASEGT